MIKKIVKVLLIITALVLCLSASACAVKKPVGKYSGNGMNFTFEGNNVSETFSAELFDIKISSKTKKGTFEMDKEDILIKWDDEDEIETGFSYDAKNDRVIFGYDIYLNKVA